MRKPIAFIIGLIGGFVAGIVITEIIALINVLVLDTMFNLSFLKYFPIVTGVGCALIAPSLDQYLRQI